MTLLGVSEGYQTAFLELNNKRPAETRWLHDLRERALKRFDTLGFPTAIRGNERWKYTNIGPIAKAGFEHSFETYDIHPDELRTIAPWDESWISLVFVNGRYSVELSKGLEHSGKAHISNIGDGLKQDSGLLREHLGSVAEFEDDAFVALNTALMHDGAFIYLPKDVVLESPVHVTFVTTESGRPTAAYPRVLIVQEPGSKLTLLESYLSTAAHSYFTNAVVEVSLAEGASLQHYRLLRESSSAYHIGVTRVVQREGSTFQSTSLASGAAIARNEVQVLLDGPDAVCDLKGLYLTSGTEHIDNHIDIDHATPKTTSHQFYKGILSGKSHAVFSGRVLVRRDSQKSVATQSDKNLILSEGAEIDTKPSLEIYADDVSCTHGATAGAISDEALYYMRSRGLDEDTAMHYLILGFANEIADDITLEPLKRHVESMTANAVPGE